MTDITANVIVSMPSQLFTMARSFKAVANGKIYIGKIDTDPVNPENQIQVYVENEDGSHVPVAQPIIINAGGYPVYNGQIAKFVTVQGHSMAVYDAYGAQQFYFPNVLKYDPDPLNNVLTSENGASLINSASGTNLQKLATGFSYCGNYDKQNIIRDNRCAIKDYDGLFWVYENEITGGEMTVPPFTVPPDDKFARYTSTGWRCIGYLNGYETNDLRNYGATLDGVKDDTIPIMLAAAHVKEEFFWGGNCRVTEKLRIPSFVSMRGFGSGNGSQISQGYTPQTILTIDGPEDENSFAITIGDTSSNENPAIVTGIHFVAIGASKDAIHGVSLPCKATSFVSNSISNFITGIKHDSVYVRINKNIIDSCNCCIDSAGGESHINDNHGYNDSKKTSSIPRPAILIRGSGTIVTQNKFFGDGADSFMGVDVWGAGNVISDNVLDSFCDVGIRIYCNNANVKPDNNIVSNNSIRGIGLPSDTSNTYRCGILLDNTGASGFTGTTICGNAFGNKRSDRSMQYAILVNAVSGKPGDFRAIKDAVISNNAIQSTEISSDRKIAKLGANLVNVVLANNAGYATTKIGTGVYSNGQIITHGLGVVPDFISISIGDGAAINATYDLVTETSFRILLKDSNGVGISGSRSATWKVERIIL